MGRIDASSALNWQWKGWREAREQRCLSGVTDDWIGVAGVSVGKQTLRRANV